MSGADLSYEVAELKRRLDAMMGVGPVVAVDAAAWRATVDLGGRVTRPLPWLTRRAATARDWWAPEPGEAVLVLCPGGDPEAGVILPALYRDGAPPPSDDPTSRVEVIDPAGGAELRCGGVSFIVSGSGIHVVGNVTVAGEVTAQGIPLTSHRHEGVTPGAAETGEPVE